MAVFEISGPNGTFQVTAPDGASQDDILAYAKSNMGGQQSAPQPAPSVAADVAKSAGIGLSKGAIGIAGLPGDIAELGAQGLNRAVSYIGNKFGADLSRPELQKPPAERKTLTGGVLLTSPDIQKQVEGVTGEFYKPQTTPGKYAETIGSFLPAAVAGPGSLARKALSQALVPGAASEFAGQATEGTTAEPYARFGGAVAGALVPGGLSRIANPMRPSAERQAAADVLRGEDVPVTAGQLTGSPIIKGLENPFGGNQEPQLKALTEAAMRQTGEAGGIASRPNVAAMEQRIGQQFDDLAARNTVAADQQLQQGLGQAVGDYYNLVSPPNRTPAVTNFLQEIGAQAQRYNGVIPGDVYQSMRSRMERAARGMGNNPEARTAIREMREALDDAMERSIAANNPADLGAWRETRNQYRNSLVIKDSITGGGQNAALGLLTPGQFSASVTRKHGANNRASGRGDFADLADAAAALLTPLPNSGTPVRSIAATGGIAAIPGAISSAIFNNPLSQAYLSGRIPGQGLLANPSSGTARDALAQALLRSPQSAQYLGYPQ